MVKLVLNICRYAVILPVLLGLAGCSAYRVIVSNPLPLDREGEMVEVSDAYSDSGRNIVSDSHGKQIPYQVTYDGKMIFTVSVKAGDKSVYKIHKGTRVLADTVCCGSFRPDRMDDFMWENDKSGYRTYGPALQKSGEKAYGYDVFTKSVPYPVMKDRFDKALYGNPRLSFHLDHGNGMDSYGVGPTLGCGASALVHRDTLVYPWCWTEYEVLDNGPMRFTGRFAYSPVHVDGAEVVETRIISVDKGSLLNKVTIRYDASKKVDSCSVAVGIVIHPEHQDAYRFSSTEGYLGYSDLGDRNVGSNGEIFCGVVRPEGFAKAGIRFGHVLGENGYSLSGDGADRTYSYYFGSGWSKAGVRDLDDWEGRLKRFSMERLHPLQVTVKR